MSTGELGNEWVGVWRPDVLGKTWMTTYECQDGRLKVRPDAPHPRLVLPLALVVWGTGLAASPAKAATWVASRPLEEGLSAIPDSSCLPVPCRGSGRCEATVRQGQLEHARGDELEAVARALTHRASCGVGGRAPYVPDWADRWFRNREASISLAALGTVDRLKHAPDLPVAVRSLVGVPRQEAALSQLFTEHNDSQRGSFGWVAYMARRKTGSVPITCRLCRRQVFRSCASCASYVAGPSPRDTVVDRLEVALGCR